MHSQLHSGRARKHLTIDIMFALCIYPLELHHDDHGPLHN